mmetsp:Transcript_84392/g.192354  ORF Transcript_84392/g.192354 Transcript_84392/m.192354 type:complete len:249 (-) Transcript_84392:45-791(-)
MVIPVPATTGGAWRSSPEGKKLRAPIALALAVLCVAVCLKVIGHLALDALWDAVLIFIGVLLIVDLDRRIQAFGPFFVVFACLTVVVDCLDILQVLINAGQDQSLFATTCPFVNNETGLGVLTYEAPAGTVTLAPADGNVSGPPSGTFNFDNSTIFQIAVNPCSVPYVLANSGVIASAVGAMIAAVSGYKIFRAGGNAANRLLREQGSQPDPAQTAWGTATTTESDASPAHTFHGAAATLPPESSAHL